MMIRKRPHVALFVLTAALAAGYALAVVPYGKNTSGHSVPADNVPAALISGNIDRARIANALASGGDPITATIATASIRIDAPSIGTSASSQHVFPPGTGTLIADDSLRILPTPGAAGRIVYDNGSSWVALPAQTSGKFFRFGGSSAPTAGTITVDVQSFSASGTWTKCPNGGSALATYVQLWGGGAGGSSGATTTGTGAASSGAPGGAGGYTVEWLNPSALNSTESVTVGAAGVGGTAIASGTNLNGNPGTAGGDSTFSVLKAGGGGINATHYTPGTSGTGTFGGTNAPGVGGQGGAINGFGTPFAGSTGTAGYLSTAPASAGTVQGGVGGNGTSGLVSGVSGTGGGGGGAANNGTNNGGAGGNGGPPGGSGGGGGAAKTTSSGKGGDGAAGAAIVRTWCIS